MTIEYPHVRRLATCPRCADPKAAGMVVCWPCHRALKKRYDGGYGLEMQRHLDGLEAAMEVDADADAERRPTNLETDAKIEKVIAYYCLAQRDRG